MGKLTLSSRDKLLASRKTRLIPKPFLYHPAKSNPKLEHVLDDRVLSNSTKSEKWPNKFLAKCLPVTHGPGLLSDAVDLKASLLRPPLTALQNPSPTSFTSHTGRPPESFKVRLQPSSGPEKQREKAGDGERAFALFFKSITPRWK